GKLTLDTPLPVSTRAALQNPTKLGLKANQTINVEDAIKGLVTKSANDAAVVVAEAIGGSEDEFAKLMTLKAAALGMTGTNYVNASGLPAEAQITTARDQAVLGMGWTGRAPAPNDSQSAWGACQEKEHPHASRIHRSRSDRYWNRSRQEHTSYDRSRFVWRHRAAREGLARTHRIEACEPATLPHWHRSRNGDTLCCS